MRLISRRAWGAVVGAVLLFVVAVTLAAAFLIHDGYQTALSNSDGQALRFVAGAETAVNRTLLGVDVLLSGMDRMLGLTGREPAALRPAKLRYLLQGALRQNLLVRNLALLDAHGKVLADSAPQGSGLSMAVPAVFVDLAFQQTSTSMMISAPVANPSSADDVLYFGRLLRLTNQTPVLVVAEVPIFQISNILLQGAGIERMEATLERSNGLLLASQPALGGPAVQRLSPPLGDTQPAIHATPMPARLDRVDALVAERKLLYQDLRITASIPMDTVLAPWRHESRMIASVALAFCLAIIAAGVAMLRYLQRMAQAQRDISHAKATLDQALDSMDNGFLLIDADHRVLNWNRRYLEIHPWQSDFIAYGVPFEQLMHFGAARVRPDLSDEARAQLVRERMVLLRIGNHRHESQLPQGRTIEVTERSTADGGIVILYQDVTQLRKASAEIAQLAFFDPLTGLPNRRLLTDRLQHAIEACAHSQRQGALLFLDLDYFKTLNDTMGHQVGDVFLQQVAQRLQTCVGSSNTLARLGGDEFVVMLQDLSPEHAEAMAQTRRVGEAILAAMNAPFDLNNTVYRSSCSVGATLFGEGTQSSSDLLKQADIAMYQVKNAGRNALCFFAPHMLAAIESQAQLENDLRAALAHQQFKLHYQLQVTAEGEPVGAEALVRWVHPALGLVSPSAFISLAEEAGLILPLGQWVLHTACMQLAQWAQDAAFEHLQLSVNVSARQFHQTDFVEQVRTTLERTGANPHLLKLELTESLVLDNVQETIANMRALKALGLRFAMDDFGTGQSSLTYLTKLPLDQLKIDQSFIRNLGEHAADAVMVQTIIGMAETLGLEVIAEGVETEAQRAFLATQGCHLCQGYLFAMPLPVAEFQALLRDDTDKVQAIAA